jgi:hypothetical protein
VLGGGLYVSGVVMIAINAFMTWRSARSLRAPDRTGRAAHKGYSDRKAVSRLPASFPPAAHKIDR